MSTMEESVKVIHDGMEAMQKKIVEIEKSQGDITDKAKNELVDQVSASEAFKAVTKGIDEVNAITAELKVKAQKYEESQKRLEDLELQIAKGVGGASDELDYEYIEGLENYLRKGVQINQEVHERVVSKAAENCYRGYYGKNEIVKELVSGGNPTGGWYIQPDQGGIVTRLFETSPMRSVCNLARTESNRLQFILDDEDMAVYGAGELTPRDKESEWVEGVVDIPIVSTYANVKISQDHLDDRGFDLVTHVTRKTLDALTRKQNRSSVRGTGTGEEMRGFLSYDESADPDVYERGKIGHYAGSVSMGLSAEDFLTAQSGLNENFQSNAKWAMHRRTFAYIMTLREAVGEGAFLLNPLMLAQGADKMLLGNSVVFMADMPTYNVAGAKCVAYANWSEAYTIADRFGLRTIRDEFTKAPRVIFKSHIRSGGAVTNFDSIKVLKSGV